MHDWHGAEIQVGDFVKVRNGGFGDLLRSQTGIAVDRDKTSVLVLFANGKQPVMLCFKPKSLILRHDISEETQARLWNVKDIFDDIREELTLV